MTAASDMYRATCRAKDCGWVDEGSREWLEKSTKRHREEHRAEREQREARRQSRYRWKGRPNPTQVRLLSAVAQGAVRASRCTIHPPTGQAFNVWYSDVHGRDEQWWPALVEAELVIARPMPAWGDQAGVWQLTAAGRSVLADVRKRAERRQR